MLTTIYCLIALQGVPGSQQTLRFILTEADVNTLANDWTGQSPDEDVLWPQPTDRKDMAEFREVACENIQDVIEVVNGQ